MPAKTNNICAALAIAAVATLGGCSTLDPYESKFMCEKNRDYGRCMNVVSAYEEALAGEALAPGAPKPGKREPTWKYRQGTGSARPNNSSEGMPAGVPRPLRKAPTERAQRATRATTVVTYPDAAFAYRSAEYRELAALIEQPITPVVRPPQVLRTLIVPYSSGDSLFMPRYVYFFADEARFVLGDYLAPPAPQKTISPTRAEVTSEAPPASAAISAARTPSTPRADKNVKSAKRTR